MNIFVILLDILAVFNPKLEGISHGMGSTDSLPSSQFNLAQNGAETDQMPEQVGNNLIFHKIAIKDTSIDFPPFIALFNGNSAEKMGNALFDHWH